RSAVQGAVTRRSSHFPWHGPTRRPMREEGVEPLPGLLARTDLGYAYRCHLHQRGVYRLMGDVTHQALSLAAGSWSALHERRDEFRDARLECLWRDCLVHEANGVCGMRVEQLGRLKPAPRLSRSDRGHDIGADRGRDQAELHLR